MAHSTSSGCREASSGTGGNGGVSRKAAGLRDGTVLSWRGDSGLGCQSLQDQLVDTGQLHSSFPSTQGLWKEQGGGDRGGKDRAM